MEINKGQSFFKVYLFLCSATQQNRIFVQILMSHFKDYNHSGDSMRVLMMIIT